MILQALYEYYERKNADSENSGEALAPSGWEMKSFQFILVLNTDGKLLAIEDMRPSDNKAKPKAWLVPQNSGRTTNVEANLMWDNIEYVLGCYLKDKKNPNKKDRSAEQNSSFIKKIEKTFPCYEQDVGIKAVLLFLRNNPLAAAMKMHNWEEVINTNGANLTFKLSGSTTLICQSEYARSIVNNLNNSSSEDRNGYCLITGNKAKIARTHPDIRGVLNSHTKGGKIISFNKNSFISYGKEQGENAPVSEEAANYYITSLNYLLSKSSSQCTYIGDTTTITWWAEKQSTLEGEVDLWFGHKGRDNPDARSSSIRSLLKGPWKGTNYKDSKNIKFYILGLAPNDSRIAIRFFKIATVDEFAKQIRRYFNEISLGKEIYPTIYSFCISLVFSDPKNRKIQDALKRLPSNLPGTIFESIIFDKKYPKFLFFSALSRIRAGKNITHNLAAIIKACLIRNFDRKDIQMTLDTNNREPGYLLGRLFSVYDKLKEDETDTRSNRRDRFMSAFMTRPQSVFSQLHRLSGFDLKKLGRSNETSRWARNHDKKIQEIINLMGGKESIPPLLNNEQQALFALGYYHQKQSFFEKKKEETLSTAA